MEKIGIIFDVDGTLLDTYNLIEKTYMKVFDEFVPEYKYTKEELKSFFGPPLEDTFRKVTNDESKVDFLVKKYREYNHALHKEYLKIFPNVQTTLEELKRRGHRLAVCSNKAKPAIELGFSITGISDYFDIIIGLEGALKPKPSPDGIYKIMEVIGENVIMVGDTAFDILTANNANIPSIACLYALTKKEAFESVNPTYYINSFEEILDIVKDK